MGYTRNLAVSAVLFSVALASGGTQDICFGYSIGNGYNVNLLIENLQSQSLSSICGNFDKILHQEYGWCSPGPVNCHTNDDGSLVAIGVSTSDRDSGFSCVEAAFIETLQASVVAGPIGIACQDLDQGTSHSKRSRIEGLLEPRAINNPSGVAQIGDLITVASTRTLALTALNFFAPVAPGIVPTLVGGFFTQLVPQIGSVLGNTGLSQHPDRFTINPWSVLTIFDAGVNGGPGNVNADDWQNIIGSLAHAIQQNGQSLGAGATFSDTATGVIVLTVGMIIEQTG